MSERRDVQSSLADMDRKLRELQRELAMVSRRPEENLTPPPAPAAQPPDAPQPQPQPQPQPTYTAPQAAVPPQYPDPAPPQYADPAQPAAHPAPPQTAPPRDPASEARAIVEEARAEAARIVEEAAGRVGAIGRQIDELQRLRDDLQRSASALVAEYERALRQSPGAGSAAGYQPGPAASPPPASGTPDALTHEPAPAAAAPHAAQPAPTRVGGEAPLFTPEPVGPARPPGAQLAAPDPPPSFARQPAPAARAESQGFQASPAPAHNAPAAAAGRRFEGQVVVNAGPFTDIATLGAFEQALARLPQTEDVYVRGFEGNRALIDLRLAEPVALVNEMRRILPFQFGLVKIGHGMVTINVDSPTQLTGGPAPTPTAP